MVRFVSVKRHHLVQIRPPTRKMWLTDLVKIPLTAWQSLLPTEKGRHPMQKTLLYQTAAHIPVKNWDNLVSLTTQNFLVREYARLLLIRSRPGSFTDATFNSWTQNGVRFQKIPSRVQFWICIGSKRSRNIRSN